MKRAFTVLLLVVALSGCDLLGNSGDEQIQCDPGYEQQGTECQLIDEVSTVTTGSLTVDPRALYYDFSETSITTYLIENDPGITYVDIEEFVDMLAPALVDYSFEDEDDLTITFTMLGDDVVSEYNVTITFNPDDNMIIYSDFNLPMIMNNYGDYYYEVEYTQTVVGAEQGVLMKIIDLDDYDISIYKEGDAYIIPLYLANLILTGDAIEVYQYDDTLIVSDDIITQAILLESETVEESDEDNVIAHSVNFTKLLFENFYGLDKTMDYSAFDNLESMEEFNEVMQEFIYALDDIHTGFYTFGYNAEDTEAVTPSTHSKYVSFYTSVINGMCLYRNDDVRIDEYLDVVVVQVNSFDNTTKFKLEETLGEYNGTKDIIIDLSCNTGGMVGGVFDLVAYLTDEPVDLYIMNSATGEKVHSEIEPETNVVLDNNFYIYTSHATFSAANLFTHIVKENDLAEIYGSNTSGGAASIVLGVLPSNMVISYSSSYLFTDGTYTAIEDGVEPDFFTAETDPVDGYKEYFKQFYDMVGYSLYDTSIASMIDIQFSTERQLPSNVDFVNYEIEIYDKLKGELISSETVDTLAFHYEKETSLDTLLVEISITVNLIKDGEPLQFEFYKIIKDEAINKIDPDTLELTIGESNRFYCHDDYDKDFFKLVITELGTYSITYTDGFDHWIYDSEGERVSSQSWALLDVGTYYVEMEAPRDFTGYYTTTITMFYDDNPSGTEITLVEGLNEVELVVNFYGDKEWVEFTLTEEAFVTFGHVNPVSTEFYIGSAFNQELFGTTDGLRTYNDVVVLLPPGTYVLGYDGYAYSKTSKVTFDVSYNRQDDISGDISLTNTNYGEFVMGENIVQVDGWLDHDIYTLTLTEETNVAFTFDTLNMVFLDGEYEGNSIRNDDPVLLQAGTYHILVYNIFDDEVGSNTITISSVVIDPTIDNMYPIEIGKPFDVYIGPEVNGEDDKDYYTFSIDDLSVLEITIQNGGSSTFYIYTSTGVEIRSKWYGHDIFELPAGDYVLMITEHILNFDQTEKYIVTIEFFTEDVDPNDDVYDESYYTVIELNGDPNVTHDSKINYYYDADYFIIDVKVAGKYYITANNDVDACFLLDGTCSSDFLTYLEVGKYYIIAHGDRYSYDDEYTITIGYVEE